MSQQNIVLIKLDASLSNSSRDNKYVTIIYDHDSNAFFAEAMKSRWQHKMI
jgi:hypothetical protein